MTSCGTAIWMSGRSLARRSCITRPFRARDVWHTIIESAWKSAEPGVVFMEYYNQMSNSWYFNPIICTNPCGEQGFRLGAYATCPRSICPSSMMRRNMMSHWEELGKVVRYSVRVSWITSSIRRLIILKKIEGTRRRTPRRPRYDGSCRTDDQAGDPLRQPGIAGVSR